MDIREDTQGRFTILSLGGELDAKTAPLFHEKVAALIDGGVNNLLIDMADLSYVSSAGLRVFLFAAKMTHRAGGHLGLVAPRELVKNVFVMAALDPMFSFYPGLDEAIKALA